MHDLNEASRQLKSAESRVKAARASLDLARDVFNAARTASRLEEYAARGITPGCKVVVTQQRFRAGAVTKFLWVFSGFEPGGGTLEDRAILFDIKATGDASKRRMSLSFIASIEPYEGSPEQAAGMGVTL